MVRLGGIGDGLEHGFLTPETSPLQVQLIGPGRLGVTAGEVAHDAKPEMVTFTRISNGPLPRPSVSVNSVALNSPWGIRDSVSRASRSLRSSTAAIARVTAADP